MMARGIPISSGSFELNRSPLVRALLASAVIAGALALAGCNVDGNSYQLPTRAMKELSPEMITLLEQKGLPKDSPILVRIFKEESELEVWKQDGTGHFQLLRVYPICKWSGELGPKVREGDRQAPEGYYMITPGLMNPNSNYYLAINTGFPNAYDKANNRTGAFLMIHGDCSSRGCYAMTDEQIGEIYSLARESFLGGQKAFQIQAYPFRMTPANFAKHRTNPNIPFWKMLKEGNDQFEVTRLEPKVDVCDRHYVFNAEQPANSTKPINFNPVGRCPVFEVPQEIAGPALEKQRNDDYQIAQLTSRNVPVAPITTGLDGGMNPVFVAKMAPRPSATFDSDGRMRAVPSSTAFANAKQSEPETTATVADNSQTKSGSEPSFASKLFGNLFSSSDSKASQTKVAAAEPAPQPQGSFLDRLSRSMRLRGSEPEPAPAPAAAPAPKPKHVTPTQTASAAAIRPKSKSEVQEAEAPKASAYARPRQEANADAKSANGAVLSGAQPVMPSGSFDSRWGGIH
jgi:murein L,D-transpeptidase YafK